MRPNSSGGMIAIQFANHTEATYCDDVGSDNAVADMGDSCNKKLCTLSRVAYHGTGGFVVGPDVVGTDVGLWEGVGVGLPVIGCFVGSSVGLPEGVGEGSLVAGRMIVGGRLGLGIAVGDNTGGELVGLGATDAFTPAAGALVGFLVEGEGLFVEDALGAMNG
jgi:hypothetical protein